MATTTIPPRVSARVQQALTALHAWNEAIAQARRMEAVAQQPGRMSTTCGIPRPVPAAARGSQRPSGRWNNSRRLRGPTRWTPKPSMPRWAGNRSSRPKGPRSRRGAAPPGAASSTARRSLDRTGGVTPCSHAGRVGGRWAGSAAVGGPGSTACTGLPPPRAGQPGIASSPPVGSATRANGRFVTPHPREEAQGNLDAPARSQP